MYLEHFGFSDFPFIQSGKDELFFVTPPARKLIVRIHHWLDCGHDFLLLSGAEGSGRAALVHHALNASDYSIQAVTVGGLSLSDTDFLHYIALELGIRVTDKDLMSLRHAIKSHLKRSAGEDKRACIVVLEADKRPRSQLSLLQDISWAPDFYLPLCSVALIGDKTLAKGLSTSQSASTAESVRSSKGTNTDAAKSSPVSLHLPLKPLTQAMTRDYLFYRMNLVSRDARDQVKTIFPEAVIQAIFEHTAGNLTTINRLADMLLMAAWAQKSSVVELRHVKDASQLLGWYAPAKARVKKPRTKVKLTGRSKITPQPASLTKKDPTTLHHLGDNVTTIGRAADCNIRIQGENISPCQALIVKTADGMFIRNEGDEVPLFLNAAKVESAALHDGDTLRIGDYELSLTTSGEGVPVLVSVPASEQETPNTA
ncbi:MAG: FHA domain-containing protein [Granulosicoccus sp.]|nr:FHA domain-containing protein [Granulosicoccus sp.]